MPIPTICKRWKAIYNPLNSEPNRVTGQVFFLVRHMHEHCHNLCIDSIQSWSSVGVHLLAQVLQPSALSEEAQGQAHNKSRGRGRRGPAAAAAAGPRQGTLKTWLQQPARGDAASALAVPGTVRSHLLELAARFSCATQVSYIMHGMAQR